MRLRSPSWQMMSDSRDPRTRVPPGAWNLPLTASTSSGGVIVSHTGRSSISSSEKPVIEQVASLTRTTRPSSSVIRIRQAVVSRVALVSRSAASMRVRASCSTLTSSSWAEKTLAEPLASIDTAMFTRAPGRSARPISACQPLCLPEMTAESWRRTAVGLSSTRSRTRPISGVEERPRMRTAAVLASMISSRSPRGRSSSMPVSESVKLRRKSSSRAETSESSWRRCSIATVSGSDMTAALSSQIWTMVPAMAAEEVPDSTAAPKGPRPSAVISVHITLTASSCQATTRTSRRSAAQTSSGSGANASGRLWSGAKTAAVTASRAVLCTTSSERRRGELPPRSESATGTITRVDAACAARTERQLCMKSPPSRATTVRAAPTATVRAPKKDARTRRRKSSRETRRGSCPFAGLSSSPPTTASAALARPKRAATSRGRPAVTLAAPLKTATPSASTGHQLRGDRATSETESPAAGHHDATEPWAGAKWTAPVPAK